jgi:hypothetical protein
VPATEIVRPPVTVFEKTCPSGYPVLPAPAHPQATRLLHTADVLHRAEGGVVAVVGAVVVRLGVAAVTVMPAEGVVLPAPVTVVVVVGVGVVVTVGVGVAVTVGVVEVVGAVLEADADGEGVVEPLALNVTSTQYWLEFHVRVGKALFVPYAYTPEFDDGTFRFGETEPPLNHWV